MSLPGPWADYLARAADQRREAGVQRSLRAVAGESRSRLTYDNRALVSFAGNDYLGLATHPRVRDAARTAIAEAGVGASASPLIVGRRDLHRELEQRLAQARGTESALLFTTGYQANLGVLAALAGRDAVIVSDQLNHASIVDGCRLSRAQVRVFPHRDYQAAAELLRETPAGIRKLLVSDTMFSMDGDMADLPKLAALADEHKALLVVDDAHAFGAVGATGRGVPELQGVRESELGVVTGTFSKTLGSLGGYACCAPELRDQILNTARSLIYSTAGTVGQAAGSLAALEVLADQGAELRQVLADNTRRLREGLSGMAFETSGQAYIVPLWLDDPLRAVELSAGLLGYGYLVPAIRPPTVPAGRALLRVSVSALHQADEIDGLLAALGR